MDNIGLIASWLQPQAVVPVTPESVQNLLDEVRRAHRQLKVLNQQFAEAVWAYGEAKREAMANRLANQPETSGSPLPDERLDQILAEHVTVTDPNLLGAIYMAMRDLEAAHGIVERTCTCHPDDRPPTPCARQYALTECRAACAAQPIDYNNPFL